ncbi:MAG: minichromosome maintenance protein MCM [Nanoarchaeota archaeon]
MEIGKKQEFELEAKRFFEAYKKDMGKSLRGNDQVVKLDFNLLSQFSPMLSEKLIETPEEIIALLEIALSETGLAKNPRIRLASLIPSASIKIKEIRAKHLDQLISIDGIVRQSSDVRPQVVNARFECPTCGAILSVLQIDRKFREPSRCSCGRKGLFKLLSKEMVDAQRIVVEESPDSMDGGEQPKRMNVFLKEDLVDPKMEERTTPGSKVKIIGILKEVPVQLQQGAISTRFDLAIEANNAIPLEETFDDLEINEEDEDKIKKLSADSKVMDKLSSSIAPSVYGFKEVKEALLLQLFSGVKKKKSDGGSTRGDIHILLVGDPGVAKSVTLKFMSKIAPKGRYVSGKSATGTGLTASVVKDEFLKGWSLEAGAMVLSNKGFVAIDEIEKMDENDRSALHEALEQQSVSISKANIQATLRTETSVLAAGNPKLGRFDPVIPIPQQINISPALLSRFDVIFILRDLPNRAQDSAIATHVLEEHKQDIEREVIDPKLLKKYIAYAKKNMKPKLTDEAIEEIKEFYVGLRNRAISSTSELKPIPITARQLEAIVRLSEASAKIRLSPYVQVEDTKIAIRLLKYSMMQVGFDEETQSFDIDRVTTGIPTSKRNKIIVVRDIIARLESSLGKLIPVNELEKELGERMSKEDLEDAINQLAKSGDIFKPKTGYIQKL